MNDKKYFKLFSNCIPVKGAQESIIMDLQREIWIDIPNLLFSILIKNRNNIQTIKQLKVEYRGEYNKGIDSYFNFLFENDFGFYTNEPNIFPEIIKTLRIPYHITTAVINISSKTQYNVGLALSQLIDLGCQSIQFRIPYQVDFNDLIEIIKITEHSRVKIVEIHTIYSHTFVNQLKKTSLNNFRFFLFLYSSDISNSMKINDFRLNFVKYDLIQYPKEVIDITKFTPNIKLYTESINVNASLYKKVSIDYNGDIKNYVDHNDIFGNINNDKLVDIVCKEEFNKKGSINNDNIEICMLCQYKYMCINNSDIIQIDTKYYKKEYCNFNPNKNEWT